MSEKKNSNLLWRITILLISCYFCLSATEPASADGPPVQWHRMFGLSNEDSGRSVQQTVDGGYIIAGWSMGPHTGNTDVYLIKTEPNGSREWEKRFNEGWLDEGYCVEQTVDGGYIIAGGTESDMGQKDVYLIKTDPNGDSEWEKKFGGFGWDWGYSVDQTADGGYIIAGSTFSYTVGIDDVYLVKTDSNGVQQWFKTFGGSDREAGYSVEQTSDGGYIIAGATESFGMGNKDVYLIKTEPNGTMQWEKTFGGSSHEEGRSVQQTSDGGYIVTGITSSFSSTGGPEVYLIKTDANGNREWEKNLGGAESHEYGNSVRQTKDGGYIITGQIIFSGGYDVYLLKTDSYGNVQWDKNVGGNVWEEGYLVGETVDGGYIVAGRTYSFGSEKGDVYLVKLCGDGVLSGDLNCDGEFNYKDMAILVGQWLQEPSILYPPIDIAGGWDGIVNFPDFSVIAGKWLEEYNPGNERPEVLITYPEDGDRLMVGGVPPQTMILAEADDYDGTVVRVEFFDGEMKLGEDTDGSDGWSYLWAEYTLGWHTLTAVAWDNEGLSGMSAPVTVEVWMPDPPPP